MVPAGIRYLRLSITDRCNLRCAYCSPWRDRSHAARDELLTLEEFGAVAREAAGLGITKLRVTGGEPLGRPGIGILLADLSSIEAIEDLALTTNGTLLRARLPDLVASRFRRLNVHLDTLDDARYLALCGVPALGEVIAGIDAAIAAGLRLKLNAVCDAGMTPAEALRLARFGLARGIDVRFIEAMPVAGAAGTAQPPTPGPGADDTPRPAVPLTVPAAVPDAATASADDTRAHDAAGRVESALCEALGLVADGMDGVARRFTVPGEAARIGFITPSHARFCQGCNKLRVSSRGVLRTCLFAAGGTDLRPLLRRGDRAAVREALVEAIHRKTTRNGREGCEVSTMVGIGG